MESGAEIPVVTSPSPEQVLGWIAAAGQTWFPARHARTTGIPRDSLDRPLNELRAAELIRVVDWVRGIGQGYTLTLDGEAAALGKKPEPALSSSPVNAVKPELEVERPPIVTPALVYANLLWYFVGLIIVSRLGHSLKTFLLDGDQSVLLRLGAVRAPELLRGEWWRLATSCFVHGTIWHLLVNVASLVMIGAVVEHLWGRGRTFILYLVAGFAGSCLAMALHPLDATGRVPLTLMGASGALCGYVAAVIAWVVLHHRKLEAGVTPELVRRLGLGVALGLAVSLIPGVSWEAHLGGAIAGFFAAILLETAHTVRGWKRVVGIVLVAMMPAACMGGLLLTIRYSAAWAPFRVPPPAPVLPDPNPHLNAVSPDGVKRGVTNATALLLTSPEKWKPERVKDVREEIGALWSNSAMAWQLLEVATGDPVVDATRAKARVFAAARRDSLLQLQVLLDRKTMPTVAEWKAWGESHQEANRLWAEVAKKE